MADDNKPELESLDNTDQQLPPAEPPIPPAIPPPLVDEEFQEVDGRRWPTIVALAIAALIVAALIVLAARAIFNALSDDNVPPAAPEQGQGQGSGSDAPSRDDKPAKKPRGSSNDGQIAGKNGRIAETGPGSTAAIFFASAFAAGALHYIVSLRRNARMN